MIPYGMVPRKYDDDWQNETFDATAHGARQ